MPDPKPSFWIGPVPCVAQGWTDREGPAPGRRLEVPLPHARLWLRSKEKDVDWFHPALPHPVRGAPQIQIPGWLTTNLGGAPEQSAAQTPFFLALLPRTALNPSGDADTWPSSLSQRQAPPSGGVAVQKGEPRPATQRRGRALPGLGPQRWPLLCGSGRCPRPRTAHRAQGPSPSPCSTVFQERDPPLRVLQWGVARPHP